MQEQVFNSEELSVLLAQCGKCPVRIMLRDIPSRSCCTSSVWLVCPQYQCPRNEVVRPFLSCDDMFLEQIVIRHFNPRPVCPDSVNHLPVQCVSHNFLLNESYQHLLFLPYVFQYTAPGMQFQVKAKVTVHKVT